MDLSRIRLFRAGTYDAGTPHEQRWGTADLDALARNHRLLCTGPDALYRPVVVIGHVRPTDDGSHTTVPAYAVVGRVWREGQELYGEVAEPAPELLGWVKGGYLRGWSVELYRSPDEANIPPGLARGARGPLLRRLAMLGGHPPRVKGLWAAGERSDRGARYATRPGWTFAEAIMDRDHLMQVAQQAGFGQQFLDGLDDTQLAGLVADLAGRMLGGGEGAPAGATPGATEPDMDDMTGDTGAGDMDMGTTDTGDDMTAPSRDQMISDLVAAGQDQQTLEQMDDASLKELWQQLAGGGGSAGTAPPATYGERDRKGRKQYIQLTLPTLQKLVRAEARTAAAKAGAPDRHRRVIEFCEQAVADGYLTPAQVERDAQGRPVGLVIKRLLRASPICFAEGVPSELEQQMREIREGQRVRSYGERLPAGPGGSVGSGGKDAAHEEKLKRHYDARLGRLGKG